MGSTLTRPERRRLQELEAVIERGLSTFVDVGRALLAIQREGLYRDTHGTWDAYCRERWGFGRTWAFRLITGAEVAEDLEAARLPIGNLTESHTRELAPLDPDGRREVWAEAGADGDPTAERVRQAREEYLTARALAALPADAQRELIEAEERRVLAGAPREVGGEGRRERLAQIERLTARVRRLVAGLGPEAEGPLRWLDRFLETVRAA